MANTVNIQTLVDGPRNVVRKIYLASDGAAGDLSDQTIVDYSALSSAQPGHSFGELRVDRIEWDLSGFDAIIEWDATTDVPIWELSAGEGFMDWTSIGGLQNDAGAGSTNDITITTNGFTASGDNGSIVIHCKKK